MVDNFDGKSSKKAISDAKPDGILLAQLVAEYKEVIASLEGLESAPQGEETDQEIDAILRDVGILP